LNPLRLNPLRLADMTDRGVSIVGRMRDGTG
jgi:hypothetical protein